MTIKELFQRWQGAAHAAESYANEIAPDGKFYLCEDWELARLESLERQAQHLKMEYCKATA